MTVCKLTGGIAGISNGYLSPVFAGRDSGGVIVVAGGGERRVCGDWGGDCGVCGSGGCGRVVTV